MNDPGRDKLAGAALLLALAPQLAMAEDTEPAYPHGEFEGDCTQCHRADRWRPAVIGPDFEHSGFPLEGSHRQTACSHAASWITDFARVRVRDRR